MYALVTGASSGIGAEFASQLAKQGKDLILVARRQARLASLANELKQAYNVDVVVYTQDLSLPEAAQTLYEWVQEHGYAIDLLVNNAGFGLVGAVQELSADKQESMLLLNMVCLQVLTRLFVADFLTKNEPAGIINVASTAAFQAVPYMATYAATKAFVLHFTEALAAELRDTKVHVMALCPGLTATEFQQTAGMASGQSVKAEMTPKDVVQAGLSAYRRRQVVVIPGLFNKVLAAFVKWVPRRVLRYFSARLVKKTLLDAGGTS